MTTTPADDRGFDRFAVEGDLTDIVARQWTERDQAMTLDGDEYRFAYLDEVPGAGPHEIFILRERDGRVFECDLWVSVYESAPPGTGQRARPPSEQVQVTAQDTEGETVL